MAGHQSHANGASIGAGSSDSELAVWLAQGAGQVLLGVRAEHQPNGETGDDQAQGALRDAGDRRSHEWLVEQIGQARPGDAVLSEEGQDDPSRLQAKRVWIIDPLDGTREFGQGRDDWAVQVALWQRNDGEAAGSDGEAGGWLTAGAMALPARAQVLSTSAPWGADPPVGSPPMDRRWRVAVSRTRPPALVGRVAQVLATQPEPVQVEYVPMGSAGVKIAAVILGQADAYLHAGGQYEWDSAAPVAVALAAGLHASRLDGQPLRYNQADTWLPDLVVCRPELAPRLLVAIATATAGGEAGR